MWGERIQSNVYIYVHNVHQSCCDVNRTLLNYGFPQTPGNTLLDRLFHIYILIYRCVIIIVNIEEVKD